MGENPARLAGNLGNIGQHSSIVARLKGSSKAFLDLWRWAGIVQRSPDNSRRVMFDASGSLVAVR
jgi:hypothetical protein